MIMSLKFHSSEDSDNGRVGLWIPLFIIVPVILIIIMALFLLALPFLLVYLIITCNMRWCRYLWYGLPAFFKTMNELPGLKVDVENQKQKIYIAFH
ncbi:MAG: hypothetical protein WB588_11540 [Dehalococcoidia bacterium]